MEKPQALHASHVSYAFTSERKAVDNVTASFQPGSLTAVIGPNGSGKTTLLRLAAGLLSPQLGEVTLSGQSLAHLPLKQRARQIALVPQREEALPDMTVMDLVLLGRTPHLPPFGMETAKDRQLALESMERTGVASLYDRLLSTLSGGELQRAAIARALCQHTPVLLLDEPVASLDIGHQAAVMNLLSRLARQENLAVACVLHDLNLAAHYADEVILLKGGRLLSSGTPEVVLTGDTLRTAYGIGVSRIEGSGTFALVPDFTYPEKDGEAASLRQQEAL